MSKISSLLSVGRGSLANSQTALQTTAHNIANKETQGFSRQRLDQVSAPPTGSGRLQIGGGARAVRIARVNNPFLEKQIAVQNAKLGQQTARADSLSRLEEIYNEQMNKGLNKYMADFFNSVRELANTPESLATRSLVRDAADFLAKDFRRVHQQLRGVQGEINTQITSLVEKVNQISIEMADLNQKINTIEIQGIPANDDRDRRDLLIKELSKVMDVRHTENEDGQVTVSAGGVVLVSGFSHTALEAVRSADNEGSLDIYYKFRPNSSPVKINERIKGGELGGLLNIRDQVVEELIGKNNEMAFTMATEVNRAHLEGTDRAGQPAGLFFDQPRSIENAARDMSVNKKVLNDVGNISAGFKGAAGDNSVAHVIAAIQNKKSMGNGTATIDDYYASIVGEIGIASQRANKTVESQQSVIDQLSKVRENVSGVSLDEELTRMVEFQKTYQASAKMIQTADELLDTVLNLKR